jgi:hypothetical protein
MRRQRQQPGLWALLLAAAGPCGAEPTRGAGDAAACTLHLQEHRSGQTLLRVPLDLPAGQAPQVQLAFNHSVLGTPVLDSYRWKGGHWHLTEEQFEGAGYGLPHAAGPGETLQRHGDGWRLLLNRVVSPLVVRPLPAQQMRLLLPDGRQWLLGTLTAQAVHLTASHC